MSKLLFGSVATSLIFVFAGCSTPELAQSPYSSIESEWETYIKRSYPAWTPPKTVPPASSVEEPVVKPVDIVEQGNFALTSPVEALDTPEMSVETESVVELVPEETAVADVEYYTVRKGDTLWRIANKFYKNGSMWRKIYEANVDVLPDPGKMKVGMELQIPPK